MSLLLIQGAVPSVDHLRYWMEIAYFASGVVIAAVASVGLYQLIIAKRSLAASESTLNLAARQLEVAANALETTRKDIEVRVTREAVVMAAQQTEKFGSDLLEDLTNVVDRIEQRMTSKLTVWELADTSFELTSIKGLSDPTEWTRQIGNTADVRDIIRLLNRMEAFAMYFAQGAADESIAFPSLAAVYCDHVRRFSPMIVLLRKHIFPGIASGPYQNLIKLYSQWADRLKKQALDAEAARLRAESAGISASEIPVIGLPAKRKD